MRGEKNMKKILIIKTGSTFPAISQKYGDFDEMIIRQMEVTFDDVMTVSVYKSFGLPASFKNIAGIIITGAHAMVTDHDPWSVALSGWLKAAAEYSLPTLGICYGHQLLAETFGGIVDYHADGEELGTAEIQLTCSGKNDPLLGVLPPVFLGHVAHSQTVVKLPKESVVLAKSGFEPHHAFVLRHNIWPASM
jgi:GMP synthase (glutamine-hydrolysing)